MQRRMRSAGRLWIAGAALAAAVAGCARKAPEPAPQGGNQPSNLGGTYVSAAPAAGRTLTMKVGAANTVHFQLEYAGKDTTHSEGSWTLMGTTLHVYLDTPPDTLVFEMQGNSLVSRRWNPERYGTQGLGTLTRR